MPSSASPNTLPFEALNQLAEDRFNTIASMLQNSGPRGVFSFGRFVGCEQFQALIVQTLSKTGFQQFWSRKIMPMTPISICSANSASPTFAGKSSRSVITPGQPMRMWARRPKKVCRATSSRPNTDYSSKRSFGEHLVDYDKRLDRDIIEVIEDEVTAGMVLRYEIAVDNNGPSDAQNVQVADQLPIPALPTEPRPGDLPLRRGCHVCCRQPA